MRCIADVHYDVVRRRLKQGREEGEITRLGCSYTVYKCLTPKPRLSKSGLGRYIVKHLHSEHIEILRGNSEEDTE